MSIRKAKRIHFILIAAALLCLIGVIFSKWLLVGFIPLLIAALFIDFRYIRCPHCGKKLITRNSHWYPNGMCPSCGKHVDENTIID